MSHFLFPSIAHCGLSLILFHRTIRYSCFSVLDGQDFHRRIQKDASICPPSRLVCIIACLPVFIADAKSLQMLHNFLIPVPVIFQSFFVLLLLYAQSGHSLKEACLCFSQAHSYLVAPLFSFVLPLFSWTPQGNLYVSLISFLCPADQFCIPPH